MFYEQAIELLRSGGEERVKLVAPDASRETFATGIAINGMPLLVNGKKYQHGWGTLANARHEVRLQGAVNRFDGIVALQDPPSRPKAGHPVVAFAVEAGGRILWEGRLDDYGNDPLRFSVDLHGADTFTISSRLERGTPADNPYYGPHANWLEPVVHFADGTVYSAAVIDDVMPLRLFPSFSYGNASFRASEWQSSFSVTSETEDCTECVPEFISPDGKLKLTLRVKIFRDTCAIEYLPLLENMRDEDTEIISSFQSLHYLHRIPMHPQLSEPGCSPLSAWKFNKEMTLRRMRGGKQTMLAFLPEEIRMTDLYPYNLVLLDTDVPLSSSAWFPFFGLDYAADNHVDFAIGWSAGWKAEIAIRKPFSEVTVGMRKTHFRLQAGEKVRMPSITALFSRKSLVDTQNTFRRHMLKYRVPRDSSNNIMQAPSCVTTWGGMQSDNHLKVMDRLEKAGLRFDVYWIDAGWFGRPRVGPQTENDSDYNKFKGDWQVNRAIHPGGIRALSERAHSLGMKLLLWIEIESGMPGTPAVSEHPDYFVPIPGENRRLLNLGNHAACDWAIETISHLVKEEGMDYCRFDFYLPGAGFWDTLDTPGRAGIAEARYVEGLYRLWDTLRQRFPDMLIDNCCCGGQRIDMETMSRSIPLWLNDFNAGRQVPCALEVLQMEAVWLSSWLPFHMNPAEIASGDDYAAFSVASTALGAGGFYNIDRPDDESYDLQWLKSVCEAADRMRSFMGQDFYPLSEHLDDLTRHAAYQHHNPQTGEGFFIIFRRPRTNYGEFVLHLGGVEADANYAITRFRGGTESMSGKELAHYHVTLTEPRSCALFFYRKA